MKTFLLITCIALAAFSGGGMLGYIDVSSLFGGNANLRMKVLFPLFFISLVAAGVLIVAMADKLRAKGAARMYRRKHPPPSYEMVAAKIAEIESEMKRIGMWQSAPLEPERYNFAQAFAMDTMAFSQWLQFVFIPRVREIISTGGEFPPYSQTAAQAVREFDGYPEADNLCSLLGQFDRLFDSPW